MNARELRQEAAKRRSIGVDSEFGTIPSSVVYLDEHLRKASSLDDKHLLFALIIGECIRAENHVAEIHFLRRQMTELPLQPVFLTSLASALASNPNTVPEAFARCEEAVQLAQHENRQVRYCLTCQVRLALTFDKYEILSSALRNLIADAGHERVEDTNYEFDFIDQIDDRRIDPELLRQYKALA